MDIEKAIEELNVEIEYADLIVKEAKDKRQALVAKRKKLTTIKEQYDELVVSV